MRLEHFSFLGIPSLGEGNLQFRSPFTVISGPNGVGKTTLLRAIWAATDPNEAVATKVAMRKLQGGNAILNLTIQQKNKSSKTTIGPDHIQHETDAELEVFHLDSASQVVRQQEFFGNFSTVEDLINGVGARPLEGQTLAELSYLARREYRSAMVYEVENGNSIVPFFEVAFGDDRYDSRTMGTGELAVFFFWWAIKNTPSDALVLIEEPETYLSPASQEAVCNFLIQQAVEKHLTIIMTSHSSRIVSSLEDENLIFVYRDSKGVKVVDGPPPPVLQEMIGIVAPRDAILLVEDEAGEIFCSYLLERFLPGLARRVELKRCDGDGGIVRILRAVGGQLGSIRFIGVFDGDVRDTIPDDLKEFSTFLPMDQAIEICFRGMIEADPDAFTAATGIEGLGPILFSLTGSDHHDWYQGLSSKIGFTKSQLLPILIQLWLRDENNLRAAQETVTALSTLSSQTLKRD